MSKQTSFLTNAEANSSRNWVVVDAENKPLGRVSSEIATVLRGKNKPSYTPHNDSGDFVVVINAEKVKLTGNKNADKTYYRHTGYVGGIKEQKASEIREKTPERLIEFAVKGMIPRTRLGRKQLGKLKVYAGIDHPHQAQVLGSDSSSGAESEAAKN